MPAAAASSPAGRTRPSASAARMASRAGSASTAATLEMPACTGMNASLGSSGRTVSILLEKLNAKPAPIDAVPADEPALDLHHLNKIELLACRCHPRIFPDQPAPIGEKAGPV